MLIESGNLPVQTKPVRDQIDLSQCKLKSVKTEGKQGGVTAEDPRQADGCLLNRSWRISGAR
jgi:hypothetical protein